MPTLKRFSTAAITLGVALVGVLAVATPAQAVMSITSTVTTASTNSSFPAATVTSSATSSAYRSVSIDAVLTSTVTPWTILGSCPSGASPTTTLSLCGITSLTIGGSAAPAGTTVYGTSGQGRIVFNFTSDQAVGSVVAITLANGAYTTGAAGTVVLRIQTRDSGATLLEQASTNITVSASSATVTFDANGGSGSMAAQTAGSATALTSNSFTRTGYTFNGWNTAANGSGAGYSDGASFAFSSSATLYAQWTGSSSASSSSGSTGLASTGAETLTPIGVAATMLVVGIALMLRRRATH